MCFFIYFELLTQIDCHDLLNLSYGAPNRMDITNLEFSILYGYCRYKSPYAVYIKTVFKLKMLQ